MTIYIYTVYIHHSLCTVFSCSLLASHVAFEMNNLKIVKPGVFLLLSDVLFTMSGSLGFRDSSDGRVFENNASFLFGSDPTRCSCSIGRRVDEYVYGSSITLSQKPF